MVVRVVEVVSSESGEMADEAVSGTSTITVTRTQDGPINTDGTLAVVEVASRPVVANAVVSATPPPNPYEGMVWIDIS